jgi:hypothetical protein
MRHYLKVSAAGLALLALASCEGYDLSGGGGGGPTPSSTTNTLGTGGSSGTSDRDTGRSSDFVTGRSRSGPIGSAGAGVSDSPIPEAR